MSGLNPAYLSALQFVEHAESAELAQQLHAAANNPRAWSEAQAALQHLLPQSGDSQAGAGIQLAELLGSNTGGREATVRLLLMGAIVGGIDAKSAPLRLKPTAAGAAGAAGLDAATRADVEWMRNQQALYAAKADLPGGLLLAGDSQGSGLGSGGEDAAGAGRTAAGSASSGGGGGNGTSAAAHALHLSWQQQQRMAPLYRLLHKHCTELERMRSAGGLAGRAVGAGQGGACHGWGTTAPVVVSVWLEGFCGSRGCCPLHRHLIPLVELSPAIMRPPSYQPLALRCIRLHFCRPPPSDPAGGAVPRHHAALMRAVLLAAGGEWVVAATRFISCSWL